MSEAHEFRDQDRLREVVDATLAKLNTEQAEREASRLALKLAAEDPVNGIILGDPDPFRRPDSTGTADELRELGIESLTTIHGQNRFDPISGFTPEAAGSPSRFPGIYDHHHRCTARFLTHEDVDLGLFNLTRRAMPASAFVWFQNGDDGYEDAPFSVAAAETNSLAVRYRHLLDSMALESMRGALLSYDEVATLFDTTAITARRIVASANKLAAERDPRNLVMPVYQLSERVHRVSRIDVLRFLRAAGKTPAEVTNISTEATQ